MEAIMSVLNTEAPLTATVNHAGAVGSWTLTIVFVIFLISAVAMAVLCYRKEESAIITDRMHHCKYNR